MIFMNDHIIWHHCQPLNFSEGFETCRLDKTWFKSAVEMCREARAHFLVCFSWNRSISLLQLIFVPHRYDKL